jgi:hypothetical protein
MSDKEPALIISIKYCEKSLLLVVFYPCTLSIRDAFLNTELLNNYHTT